MQLTSKGGGFTLIVKVVPGASRTRIAGAYGDGIRVTVAAAPERGAANAAVIELLAEALRLPRENVQILHGHSSPRKEILIAGLPADAIKRRLR
jgi:uncharacterized protein (TIGR00251 family)